MKGGGSLSNLVVTKTPKGVDAAGFLFQARQLAQIYRRDVDKRNAAGGEKAVNDVFKPVLRHFLNRARSPYVAFLFYAKMRVCCNFYIECYVLNVMH